MFLFGFIENIRGVSYPLIKNEFAVSYEAQGIMIFLTSLSYTLFMISSGFVMAFLKIKKIYIFSFSFMLLGISSIYVMGSFWTVTASLFLVSAGFGICEIAVNSVATKLFVKKSALMMNLLHFMYGAGAIGGPMAAGILTNPAGLGLFWRHTYLLTIPMVLLIFISAVFAQFPSLRNPVENTGENTPDNSPKKTKNFISALKTPAVWAFGITLGMMGSVESASVNWGGLYFQDLYGMDPTTRGASFVSAFYVLFTISRLVSGFIIEKVGYLQSLAGAMILSIVIFAVGFALGADGIYVLPLLGFFLAILWPTMMAVAIGRFGSNAPVMTAAILAITGLLMAGIQLLMGYFNQWIGPAWGYRSCILFSLIIIAMLLGFRKQFRKPEHYHRLP